jgi:hypothetical protein
VFGSYAYLADGYTGVRILDVSDRSAPREIGYHEDLSRVGVDVLGASAYVADDAAGIKILDVSDPSSIRGVGRYDTPVRRRTSAS